MAGRGKMEEEGIISELNVTPLVEVMTVLLAVFMVTATYIVAQSIPVDLPEASTGEDVTSTMVITITEDGVYYLDGQRVDDAAIRRTITRIRHENPDLRVIIAADQRLEHGKVVRVIDLVRRLGVSRFAINIEAEEE